MINELQVSLVNNQQQLDELQTKFDKSRQVEVVTHKFIII